MEKEKTNVFNVMATIIKIICIIILILLIAVLGLQRFSKNEIAIGGYRIFSVATESMVPEYLVGDVLIVKEIDENDLQVGDDVSYLGKASTFAGKVVTHRIVEIDETENGKVFHTKGIANEVEDPTITGEQIYGKVVYKTIILSMLTKLVNNMTAFYLVVFIPLGILIFLQIKDIADSKRENSKEDEEEDDDDNDNDEDEE